VKQSRHIKTRKVARDGDGAHGKTRGIFREGGKRSGNIKVQGGWGVLTRKVRGYFSPDTPN